MANKNTNIYGVKVGDVFKASWGWEQTNVDFFQVIKLCGDSSVRVREVNPPIAEREYASSGMASTSIYEITGEILPPAEFSVFIKDQEKGDLKRLRSFQKDGSHPQFYLTSYADAYYVGTGKCKTYESWYY